MSIALSLGNNLTTGGIFKPAAVNNTSVNNVTDFAGIAGGGTLVLLSTQTASASSSISFTTGIDSTYDEYVFKFISLHPSNSSSFRFNMSTDGGSNYNVTKTTTYFRTSHNEDGTGGSLTYDTGQDLAQSTADHTIGENCFNADDVAHSGYLHLFAPSSTTYVKHFIAQLCTESFVQNRNQFTAGYGNTTSAVNAVTFKFSSGTIDDGIIKMYGVAKS